MLVTRWLGDWVERWWPERFGVPWPGRDSDDGRRIYSAWLKALIDIKATDAEANQAAGRLADQVIASDGEYLAAILREIDLLRRRPSVVASDRESAERESKDCPYCGGHGMATIFHSCYTGDPVIEVDGRRIAGRAAAHCVCKLGEWMRSKVDAETRKRIPALVDCLEGRSVYQADDPTIDREADWFEPIGWREMVERLADRSRVEEVPK